MAARASARICGAALLGLLLAGTAGSAGQPKAAGAVVTIENVRFDPQELTVKSGERVTWVNKDLFPHTATADAKTFDSRSIAPSGTWTWVAGKPGTYAYTCTFHPTMKATVRVQ
jgi:plastocyanin